MERKIEKVEVWILNKWQSKWNLDTHGRETYKYIKNVGFTGDRRWFRPPRSQVYILTGYGSINSSLYKRGSIGSPLCPLCGQKDETTEHIIFECVMYEKYRYEALMTNKENWERLIETEGEYNK